MPFLIYNSLSQKKEVFSPLNPPKATMYCCGPTVYDLLHIGNFRGAVVFNFLRQWLEYKGYQVTYGYNFTDVDDKILNRAKKENKPMKEIADKYIHEFKKDFHALKLKEHEYNPQATQFISEMIQLIKTLLKNKKAYLVDNDVFYSVQSFPEYGKLSRRKEEMTTSQSRIEVDKRKKDPRDFALWKSCPEEDPGWDSPWGRGRPGWHLECTTMIFSLLGNSIDIHGGGSDLIFPHHENELAQAEGAKKEPFVKYWVHNNMFTFGGEKMAKSTGNVSIMRAFLEEYNGEIFKYLVLSSHYRSRTEVSEKKILQCIQALFRIYTFLKTTEILHQKYLKGHTGLEKGHTGPEKNATLKKPHTSSQIMKHKLATPQTSHTGLEKGHTGPEKNATLKDSQPTSQNPTQNIPQEIKSARKDIETYLDDDLNTPSALAVMFTLIRKFNEKAHSLGHTNLEKGHTGPEKNATLKKPHTSSQIMKSNLSTNLNNHNSPEKELALYAQHIKSIITGYGKIMSLFQEPANLFLQEIDEIFLRKNKLDKEEINKLVIERDQARKSKNFKRSDEIREQLKTMNILVQDSPEGTTWEPDKTRFLP